MKTVIRHFIGIDYSGAQTPTASRRNAARHRLLTAAPLERLHLCCKGSREFVESSLSTVLLRNFHRRSIF